jgi:hypothetical protein
LNWYSERWRWQSTTFRWKKQRTLAVVRAPVEAAKKLLAHWDGDVPLGETGQRRRNSDAGIRNSELQTTQAGSDRQRPLNPLAAFRDSGYVEAISIDRGSKRHPAAGGYC